MLASRKKGVAKNSRQKRWVRRAVLRTHLAVGSKLREGRERLQPRGTSTFSTTTLLAVGTARNNQLLYGRATQVPEVCLVFFLFTCPWPI